MLIVVRDSTIKQIYSKTKQQQHGWSIFLPFLSRYRMEILGFFSGLSFGSLLSVGMDRSIFNYFLSEVLTA
jgi:hypothetical protein